MLYGGISTGDIRKQHEAKSNLLTQVEKLASSKGQSLPSETAQRYGQFVQGFRDTNGLQDRLSKVSNHLRKFAPVVDEENSIVEPVPFSSSAAPCTRGESAASMTCKSCM